MVDGVEFSRTICSICFEDLKPVVEDLQSISICGHVFHELCLQQWFEYCARAKKYSCPVCKQNCRASDVARLYFQSVGEVSDVSLPEKPIDCEVDAGVLRREVKRLEVIVSGLSSAVERQVKELRELNDELCTCKEQAKLEKTSKNEALTQKAFIQQQLNVKSAELEKTNLECSRLQDRNMALAKELAAFKLVSDLDLDEEDIMKYASLGNGANSKDMIDTLRKSLVLRNRSYKELITKCNLLGRGEARYGKKLEKAREKINKLKARVQELETAAEVRENDALRSLTNSKKTNGTKNLENRIDCNSELLSASKLSSKEQGKQSLTVISRTDHTGNINKSLPSAETENFNFSENKDVKFGQESRVTVLLDEDGDGILIDEDASTFTKDLPSFAVKKPNLAKSEVASGVDKEKYNLAEPPRIDLGNDLGNAPSVAMDDLKLFDNDKEVLLLPKINIRKENPLPSTLPSPGDICFSGGLLGPDGTQRYLGKWCKRAAKGSSNGDLIAVGADGRGGRVKVLRSQNQVMDNKENSHSSKRLKVGPQKSTLQTRGCLQIEHFFARATE
ncbi:hypothetical protein L6164_003943 [Bauhinia variegata]|uniref:Uncharacterized protein n=1 Tax=Bauhinia variegata TaxID=167791 RepID=A0ACB9Q332_BAUVA|nr:hypothetical protein L6164_003943 [Bauhinia variegata]